MRKECVVFLCSRFFEVNQRSPIRWRALIVLCSFVLLVSLLKITNPRLLGGVRKEWFILLVRQLFRAEFGVVTWDDETRLCWFNVHRLVGAACWTRRAWAEVEEEHFRNKFP
jgi:hypothetical protein